MPYPTVAQVRAWLQVPATVVDDEQLTQVLVAETALQAAYCIIDDFAPFPDELTQALYRRVGREIAGKGAPLGVIVDEFGQSRLTSWDAEIDRLEAPHRTIAVA